MGALSALLGCDMIHTCCCLAVAVRMREVLGLLFFIFCTAPCLRGVCLFFLFFRIVRGRGKSPEIFFQKNALRYHRGKRPGASLPEKSCRPGGVYSHYYYYGIRMVSRIVYNVVFADLVVTK